MLLDHNGYAAGIADTAAYDAISRDLIGRWAYPLCPDSNPVDGPSYTYHRGAVYKASSVFLGRESRVEHHVVLGPNSYVADFATVSDSVLGVSCRIDEGAVVRGSYLFAGSTIGKNSVVERAMLGERVTVLDNVVIERGCIIGDDVTIGPNVRIKAFTRIARRKPLASESFDDSDFSDSEVEISSDEEDDEDLDGASVHESDAALAGAVGKPADPATSEAYDTHILGERGIGFVWEANAVDSDDWDEDDDAEEDPRNAHLHWIGSRYSDTVLTASELRDAPPSEDEVSDSESDILELDNTDALASDLAGVHLGQPSSSKSRAMQEDFRRELELTLDRSLSENHAVEVTALEMNTLRMAFDGNLDEMRRIVVEKVLLLADFSALASSLKKVLQKWGDLIKRNIYSNSDQVNVVDIVERHCALSEAVPDDKRAKLFALFVKFLYELDVIEDLTVLAWNHKAGRAGPETVSEELVQVIQPLVEWLEESDDESEEDDDEDDESEEE
ncbi:translation initiation factor eIF-2B epsilon subunit, GEF [Linderina pennispora]|nr:translation initiation factor eIF-2B epsilon subunit, GEF [Linderina pennispora]